MKLGEAFGNGYYRWQPVVGDVFTHILTALDPSKRDFGATWLVHATGLRFPANVQSNGDLLITTWFPAYARWNRDANAWEAQRD